MSNNLTNSPRGSDLWSAMRVYSRSDTVRQVIYGQNGKIYTRNFQQSAWTEWRVTALQSDVDALNSNSVPLKLLSKANSRNYTLHLPSNGRYLIFAVPNSASDMTAVLATIYGSGAVYINNISGQTNTTFTTGTNTLTASTSTTTPVTFNVLVVSLDRSVGVSGVTIS